MSIAVITENLRRLLIPASRRDEIVGKLVARASTLKLGDPLAATTKLRAAGYDGTPTTLEDGVHATVRWLEATT